MPGKLIFTFLLGLLTFPAIADNTRNHGWQALEQQRIGWERAMEPMGNAARISTTKAKTLNGITYSPYQLGLMDTFGNWFKQSYTPIGGLPQISRLLLPDATNERPNLPQGSGVVVQLWAPSYDDARQKIVKAQPASAYRVRFLANHLPGMEPATWFNDPDHFWFTMYYDPQGRAMNNEDQAKITPRLDEIRQATGDRLVYFTGNQINVVLSPMSSLPVEQVTRGEVLDRGETTLRHAHLSKRLTEHQLAEYLVALEALRQKYRDSLAQPAFINHPQLTLYSINKTRDLFEETVADRYMFPVYRIKPQIYTQARQDRPVWLSISWEYANDKANTAAREIHQAMLHNFNFDYAYDYLFEPGKVKGQTYKPRSPDYLRSLESRYEQP